MEEHCRLADLKITELIADHEQVTKEHEAPRRLNQVRDALDYSRSVVLGGGMAAEDGRALHPGKVTQRELSSTSSATEAPRLTSRGSVGDPAPSHRVTTFAYGTATGRGTVLGPINVGAVDVGSMMSVGSNASAGANDSPLSSRADSSRRHSSVPKATWSWAQPWSS